ncbi:MAG: translation initiation factor 2 [Clostridiales bacterium]|nr:translation initiation factor 2 [Clostridiales bacterium]MCF8023400.1 translation initiation factor 2 [Clostridiales bacterium]
MDENNLDVYYLKRRVQELEEKVSQLRLSRRVLMNLIEKMEKEKSQYGTLIEKENKKLHYNNYKYAKWLLHKNRRIIELETELNKHNTLAGDK